VEEAEVDREEGEDDGEERPPFAQGADVLHSRGGRLTRGILEDS
jgi:hypothetical protein